MDSLSGLRKSRGHRWEEVVSLQPDPMEMQSLGCAARGDADTPRAESKVTGTQDTVRVWGRRNMVLDSLLKPCSRQRGHPKRAILPGQLGAQKRRDTWPAASRKGPLCDGLLNCLIKPNITLGLHLNALRKDIAQRH